MKTVIKKLKQFKENNNINTKGPLCVVLVITRTAINDGIPLNPQDLITEKSGQVKGLGKAAVQKILKEYGIEKVLASEGGRTSRGSIGIMKNYVEFLNSLKNKTKLDLNAIEAWWVEKVKEYFSAKPFKLDIDSSKSLSQVINALINQAAKRQSANQGTMYVGALMQHLIGAKLELALPTEELKHNSYSTADAPKDREGDFLIGNTAIHVTATPTEALIDKCKRNLDKRIRPIIITSNKGTSVAEGLSENKSIDGRVEIFEIEQFITTNIYEISSFRADKQETTISEFIEKYNKIIDDNETDPSLKIQS